jgi:hypothetical protein
MHELTVLVLFASFSFGKDLLALRNNRWNRAFIGDDASVTDLKASIVIEHKMQAADVAHTTQHWHVYQRWNEKLSVEMCKACDAGRGPDKHPALGWYKLWFFDNFMIPLAQKLD